MITEIAILNVESVLQEDFESDFKKASQYIESIGGYMGHSLKKCIEEKSRYILIVYWRSLEDHEIGFRKSSEYKEWKQLLHHYYNPFPVVEHYESVYTNAVNTKNQNL